MHVLRDYASLRVHCVPDRVATELCAHLLELRGFCTTHQQQRQVFAAERSRPRMSPVATSLPRHSRRTGLALETRSRGCRRLTPGPSSSLALAAVTLPMAGRPAAFIVLLAASALAGLPCDRRCNGRGVCEFLGSKHVKRRACKCFEGWTGSDCSFRESLLEWNRATAARRNRSTHPHPPRFGQRGV